MIVRRHSDEGTCSQAVYSLCELYRYSLERQWDGRGKRLLYVMLNPSTATELANDPTVERCERRARAHGYGAMRVCNIFAWRATDPGDLKRADDPVGPENTATLCEAAEWADDALCAWGVHGAHAEQGRKVGALLSRLSDNLMILGSTQDGHPRHPLYVAYSQTPIPWNAKALAAYISPGSECISAGRHISPSLRAALPL